MVKEQTAAQKSQAPKTMITITGFTSGPKHGFALRDSTMQSSFELSWCDTRQEAKREALEVLRQLLDKLERME